MEGRNENNGESASAWGARETEAAFRLIRFGLEEDLGSGDVTTASIAGKLIGSGKMLAKAAGVVAGLPIAGLVYEELGGKVTVDYIAEEGKTVSQGTELLVCRGDLTSLVSGERLILNFIQRLSGTATMTSLFMKELAGTGAVLLDTRKTTPGFRILEKYAVRIGGGKNHRMGLWDMALIKENHVRMAGGISNAVKMVRRSCGAHFPVEVEVTSMTELEEALSVAPDRIMLDNMTVDETAKAVKFARNIAPSVKLESSGGITLENIRKYGLTGVDYISVGAVTHSAPALDITFLLDW